MQGIEKYREALLQFTDAYCIESRLAIQLAGLGLMDEAARHYQRAFELMPDSFGRVESHCFGCENAFQGGLAQKTAEQVFARLVESKPYQPQIHYLIGYLREAQQRFPEAIEAYQRAVKLDPGYLNAWKKFATKFFYLTISETRRFSTCCDLTRSASIPPRQRAKYLIWRNCGASLPSFTLSQ